MRNQEIRKKGIYEKYIKRLLDFVCALLGLVILSPLLLVLTVIGTIAMKGNPFFAQERPGKDEKIFKMIKFKSMNEKKDKNGILLPDVQRITKYGHFIRNTSLDELPELLNILKGDMSLIGPRPLLVKYLPLYNERQHRRHDVRPGLTGLAQVKGRNTSTWEERFEMDIKYVEHITFLGDITILFDTIRSVLRKEGINSSATTKYTMAEFTGTGEDVE